MSVWGRSQASGGNNYVIFASSVSNEQVCHQMIQEGVTFKSLIGMYKGIPEHCYIVNYDNLLDIAQFLEGEESILVLGAAGIYNRRPATLRYLESDKEEYLGYLRDVPKEDAVKEEAWTYDPDTGKYFVAIDDVKRVAPSRYEVQQYTLCEGWVNTWSEDGANEIFDSEARANKEIDLFIEEIETEIINGDRAPCEGYSKEDFRVVEISG